MERTKINCSVDGHTLSFGSCRGVKLRDVSEHHLYWLLVQSKSRNPKIQRHYNPIFTTILSQTIGIPKPHELKSFDWISFKQFQLLRKTGFRCVYCGEVLNSKKKYTTEHKIARNKGGSNSPQNITNCCKRCNSMKGDKSLEEFRFVMSCNTAIKEAGFTQKQLMWLTDKGLFEQIGGDPNFKFHFERGDQNGKN